MPPKKKFTKQQIIDAAFEIAKVEGIEKIAIRKVAEKLGSSIAPIYVNFDEVEDLIKEVVRKVATISQELLLEQNSGNPFRDIGVASIRFAKEYSVLYRDLVMKQNKYMEVYEQEMGDDLITLMKKDSDLEDFTKMELKDILLKMKVFQTGLSVMVANGLLPKNITEADMIEILDSASEDIIMATRIKKKENID